MESEIKSALIITILILFVMFLVFRIDFVKNIIIGAPATAPISTTTA